MNKLLNATILAVITSSFLVGSGSALAQGRRGQGNFDPAQFRQTQLETYRERLEITNEDEWKAVSARIEKVLDARTQLNATSSRGGGGRGGRGGGGQGGQAGQGGQGQQGRGGFGGQPSPELEALQAAVEANVSGEELKSKLAKLREARKASEGKLASAQDELRRLLSVRQEAAAVVSGLLN